jgi:hypothetical protein
MQKLAACTAHRNSQWRDHYDRVPIAISMQNRLTGCDALSAYGHRVRSVLDVASTIDISLFGEQRTSHRKTTIRIVCGFCGVLCRHQKLVQTIIQMRLNGGHRTRALECERESVMSNVPQYTLQFASDYDCWIALKFPYRITSLQSWREYSSIAGAGLQNHRSMIAFDPPGSDERDHYSPHHSIFH